MFDFIAFALKLVFSAILGGIFSYAVDDEDHDNLINMTMIALFATTLVGLTIQFSDDVKGFLLGAVIFTILYVTNTFSSHHELRKRLIYIFAAVLGILVGSGYTIQGILLTVFLYFIIRSSTSLFEKLDDSSKDAQNTESVENISK